MWKLFFLPIIFKTRRQDASRYRQELSNKHHRRIVFFPKRYFLWVCMSSFGGCMWDVNDVTVWPGSSTSPPSDPRRGTVWYGLAANGPSANRVLRVCRRSDFIYTKNSAIGRSDFIYTKNSARLRYDFIYTKNSLRKSWKINDVAKNFPRCARQFV